MNYLLVRFLVVFFGSMALLSAQSLWLQRMAKDPARPTAEVELDQSVPTPDAVTGYVMGDRYGTTAELHAYLDAVESKSSRVKVRVYGKSGLGRPLKIAIVTDPKNHEDLDALKERNVAIPLGVKVGAEHPLVVFLLAGVHGDEASGGEAMLGLLHYLAADRSAATTELLKRVIVVIDPAQNPDGRDRFVTSSRDREGVVPEQSPLAYEHQQSWPSGRTSRNGFDLNRDWFLGVEPETRARLELVNRWCPQVVADLHEMPSDEAYFTSTPPCPPVNEHCSEQVKSLWKIVGASIESHFVAQRTVSFSSALYPLDYPGYGGSYNALRGSCGMTFEQGMPSGRSVLRNDGSTLTLSDAALHHATASLATLRACSVRHAEVLAAYQEHFVQQASQAATDHLPIFVFPPSGDSIRHREFRDLLIRNHIRVEMILEPMTIEAAGLDGADSKMTTFPSGSLVVTTAQPLRPLVKALLDPKVVMEEGFRKDEEARLARLEPSHVYDVTAWNVPLGFGVVGHRIAAMPKDVRREAAKASLETLVAPTTANAMAIVVPGDGIGPARVLSAWWEKGIRSRIATAAFTTATHSFPAGSLVALAERHSEPQLALAASEAVRLGVMPVALESLTTVTGPSLGTSSMRVLAAPRVTLAFGHPFQVNSAGSLRRFLKVEAGLSILTASVDHSLPRALEVSDVLVIPDADSDALMRSLADVDLKGFVNRGGVVVAMKGAALALSKLGLVGLQMQAGAPALQSLQGPILQAIMSPNSWLSHGISGNLAVQPRVKSLWTMVEDRNAIVKFAGLPVLSGELPQRKREFVSGATFVGHQKVGLGAIIVFAEDPTLRGATPGLYRLLANAVMLGPALGR